MLYVVCRMICHVAGMYLTFECRDVWYGPEYSRCVAAGGARCAPRGRLSVHVLVSSAAFKYIHYPALIWHLKGGHARPRTSIAARPESSAVVLSPNVHMANMCARGHPRMTVALMTPGIWGPHGAPWIASIRPITIAVALANAIIIANYWRDFSCARAGRTGSALSLRSGCHESPRARMHDKSDVLVHGSSTGAP